MAIKYVKPAIINLKNHPNYNEKWVQDIIVDDPSILGLGNLTLKDRERIQPHAGRLDLLLQDEEEEARYEVEIQLGRTDESHIIRTIEYYDIERKRYPRYEHCAVIIAEDITSRFLNVISLFNGAIPLIAIQMKAIEFNDNVSLLFTTVLNQMPLGFDDEEEDTSEVTDRNFWEQKRGTKETVAMVDKIFELLKTISTGFELKYTKNYIGIAENNHVNNFVRFIPQRNGMKFGPKIIKAEDLDKKIEISGLDLIDYNNRRSRYRIRLNKNDIENNTELILELLKLAYGK
jgi:hypothetical protein